MGKALGSIFNVITSPLSLIDKTLGNIVSGIALTAIGIATGNPALIGLGLSRLSAGFASTPKPPTTETAIKAARPPRVSAYGQGRLFGAYILYETASDGTACDAFAVHHGQLTEVIQYYLADDRVTVIGNVVQAGADGRYDEDAVRLYSTTGGSPGATISALTTLLPGIWTADHRGDDVVILAATFASVSNKNFLKVYPNGAPTASMAAKWQKCPDPYAEDPTDEANWTWTENSIRHLMHYKMVREGVDFATKIAPTIEYWQAAADECDEAVALKEGGTEPRYRSCVAHQHTMAHKDVTNMILATCDGWISPRADGALVVRAGKYHSPTVSIGSEHIVSYSWEGVGVDDDRAINQIICSYVSAAHDYTQPECDAWTDEADITARGAILSTNLDPQAPSYSQVRRLAKRLMQRTNAPNRGTVTTNVAGRIVRGERYIWLRIEDAGAMFYDGPVEVVALQRNNGTGGVTFSWVAADANIDAWNPVTEQGDPAPVGTRVPQEPLDAPALDLIEQAGDPGSTSALLDITGPDRTDLTWFIHWRLEGASVWGPDQEYPDIDESPAVQLLVNSLPLDVELEFEVSYQVGDGRVSPWSNLETVTLDSV